MPSDVLITPASSKIDFTDGANSTKRLNISGTAFSFNSNLNVLSTTSLSSAFKAEGVNGTLFEVTDDLSNSLMSVNTISGLPVFEVFANNSIIGGQYGANDFVISGNKIGLGYASPVNKLSVSGSVSIGASYNVAAPSNGLIVQGDVGIGTATPTSQTNYRFLQVNGPVSAIIETTVAGVRIGGFDSTSNTLYVGTIGAFPIVFRTGVDEKWRITNAGVLQSSTAQTIQTATGILTLATLAGDGHIVLSPHGNGKVGIGTASLIEKLHVLGNVHVESESDTIGGGGFYLGVSNSRNLTIRQTSTNKNFAFDTFNNNESWKNRITILNSGGNVGIGSVSPSSRLHVYSSVTGSAGAARTTPIDVLTLESENTDNQEFTGFGQSIVFRGSTYNNAAQRTLGKIIHQINDDSVTTTRGTSLDFQLLTDGTGTALASRMYIRHDGNVGIGTVTPAYKLDVNGTTRFGGIVYNEAVQTDDFNYFNLQPYIESETLSSILSVAGTAPTFATLTNTTAPFSKVLSVSAYGDATMSGFIPVQAGETIYGEIWAYRATGAAGTAGVLYCGVQRYDKDKNMIDGNAGLNTSPSGYFIASNVTIPSNSTWTKYSGTLVLPTSHTVYNGSDGGPVRYIRPYIIYNYTGGTILTYIGGWKIRKVELTRDLGIVSINGSVGVGTISPNEKLSVYPGITGGIALQAGDGTTRSYYFIDNTNPTYSTGIRTNNYYLDFDSSGASQNAIRFYTGTSTIGTGTERMRITSNGNIGIGLVTSPNHLLHLSTVSNDVSIGLYTTNANASARNWLISTNEIAYGDFNIKQSNAIGGNPRSAGTSRFYIQNDGNVGIGGATSPIGKLQLGADYANDGYGGYDVYVKSTTAGTLSSYDPRVQNTSIFSLLITDSSSTTNGPDKIGLVLHNNNATAGAFSPMLLFTKKESGSTPYKATMAGIYARSPLGTGDTDSWIDGELIFATAGAASEGIKQRMVINKEGYVGIGITIPTAKLDVLGVRLGRDFSLANRATVRLDSNGIAYPSDVLFGHTAAANQDGWTSVYWSLSSRADANSNRFYFYRGGGHPVPNNSEAVIMSFDPNLNVGVGFEAPTNRLSIAGSVSIGSNYNTAATTNGLIVEGNVGVGVTVPTAKLDVTGSNTNGYSLLLRSGDNYNGTDSVQIAFGFANQTNYRHSIRTRHNPLAPISGVVGNNIDFYAWKRGTDAAGDLGSQFVMTMQGDGYVGIGITNPLTKLHINSTTSGETLLRADGTNGTLFSVIDDLSDSLMSVNNSAGLPVLEVFADDRVVAGQYGANDFVLRNNKLGLGTSNPVYRLNVYDISSGSVDEVFAGTIGNDQVVGGRTGGSFGISTKSTSNGNLILTANSAMYLRTGGGNDRVFIKSDGNVGIGTVSPAEKLDVSGSIIANSIASTDYTRQLFPSGGYFYAGGAQTGAIKIKLPANTKSTFPMLSFTCHIYNYSTGTSRTFKIGGHFSTSSWYNPFAYCLSDNVGNLNVRWGFEGTSICVWIGETNSGWSYPNVFITDFQNGYSSISNIWMTGWTVSLATAFDTITNGPYAPGYFWNQNNDGAGSGLDADLLDGYNSATANTANTIVLRDGSGNFSAGTITASLTGSVSGTAGSETFATVTGRGSGTATQISVATTSAGSMVTGEKLGSGYSDGVSGATFKSITNHPTGGSYAFAAYYNGLLGTNSFFVAADGTGYFKGNVGIGITSPAVNFEVLGASETAGTIRINGGKVNVLAVEEINSALEFAQRDISISGIVAGKIASISEFSNGAYAGLGFYTAKQSRTPELQEAVRINYDGNVGIGITSPSSKLDVVGSARLSANLLSHKTASYTTSYPGINSFGADATDSGITYYDTGKLVANTQFRGIVWTGKHYIFTDQGNSRAYFYDNNFVQITNAYGYYFVTLPLPSGYSTPHGAAWDGRYLWCVVYTGSASKIVGYDLDTTNQTATIIAESAVLPINATYDIEYADGHLYLIYSGTLYIYKWNGSSIDLVSTYVGSAGTISAQAITYDGSYLWVTQNGANIYKVGLDGTSLATITTFPPNITGWAWNGSNIVTFDFSNRNIFIINTARLRIDTQKLALMGGNVGIGAVSPGAKLHIIGNTNIDAGLRGGTVHIRDSTASASPATAGMSGVVFSSSPGTDWAIGKYWTGTTSRFVIKDAGPALGTNLLSIDANGNVGIGADNPSFKLDVNGSARFVNVVYAAKSILSDSSGVNPVLEVYNTVATNATTAIIRQTTAGGNGNQDIGLLVDIQGANDLDRIANFRYYNGSTYTSRMAVTRGGNVGIGIINPIAKLNVLSSTSLSSVVKAEGINGTLFEITDDLSNSLMSVNTISGLPVFEVFANNSIIAGQYGQNDFVISGNKVGIGTSSPAAKLQISGSYPHIILNNPSAGSGVQILFQNNGAAAGFIGHQSATSKLQFSSTNASVAHMTIDGNGNVGVGVASPADKLEVNGTTRTKKLRSNGIYYVGITGAKTSNASAFDMFDIINTGGNQTIEIVLSHHHSGGGQHGSFRRVILALNGYVAVIVLEDTSTNFGGGLGFTITRTSVSTIRIGWAGATAFASGYTFAGWIKGNGDYSVTNVGMDSLDAA